MSGVWHLRLSEGEPAVNLILIGAQGSGKGTQAQRLVELHQLKACASGELLRKAIAQGTPIGRAAQPYLDRGDLVPDDLTVGLVLDCLENRGDAKGVILDGFPRNVAQARALDERLTERRQKIDAAIYLEVPRDELMRRLSGRYLCRAADHVWNVNSNPTKVPGVCDYDGSPLYQRADDTAEKIAHRLDIFFSETIRLTDYYGLQGKLLRLDGTGPIDAVTQAIVGALAARSVDRAVG
jgi:adenylate kinase